MFRYKSAPLHGRVRQAATPVLPPRLDARVDGVLAVQASLRQPNVCATSAPVRRMPFVPHQRSRMHRRYTLAAAVVALLGSTATTAQAASSADPTAAANKANDYVNGRPAKLHASSSDKFHQHDVITTKDGLQYVPYDRSYKGLKVRGGDFVV